MGTVIPLNIDIGGIRIAIGGLDRVVSAAAAAHFQPFLSAAPAQLTVEVELLASDQHAPEPAPRVERRAAQQYAVAYGELSAELDLAAGVGTARLPSSVRAIDSLLRIAVSLLAVERHALLVHASGVRLRDKTLVCFGPSGVGKTTVARSVPPGGVLSDECVLLTSDGSGAAYAHGTPFCGELTSCAPLAGEVVALLRLQHASSDSLTPLSEAAAARALLSSTIFFCQDPGLVDQLLSTALAIGRGRTYQLGFRRETHVPTFVESMFFS